MKLNRLNPLQKLSGLLVSPGLEPAQKAARILRLERDIVLPIKAVLIVTLIYYFYFSPWFDQARSTREVALETINKLFLCYIAVNIVAGIVLIFVRQFSLTVIQWSVFAMGLLDGLLLASLTLVTGGFESPLYYLFLGLIIHNAICIPLATPQIVLNLSVIFCFFVAGLLDVSFRGEEAESLTPQPISTRQPAFHNRNPLSGSRSGVDIGDLEAGYSENSAEPFILRIIVLVLMTLCCYGVQALFEKQRRLEEEFEEFNLRQGQLQTAGRLAAEIAHQIKNPLGIINNSIFTLQRSLEEGKGSVHEQIQIIREEVERADRIVTELMGYAQLAEGTVERLNVIEELERALALVFPPAAKYEIKILKNFGAALPSLLMQRNHLSEVFVNILQNAREAMNGKGRIEIKAQYGENYSVRVTIVDNGPGIPPDKIAKIFESYFTTKEKGTGLGLAIARHNTEIYGGSIQVESELGKGSRFILQFPAKTLLKLNQ